MCGVEVRVRYHYRFEAAFRGYEIDCRLVDEGDQIPKDVARRGEEQDTAFAYAELFKHC